MSRCLVLLRRQALPAVNKQEHCGNQDRGRQGVRPGKLLACPHFANRLQVSRHKYAPGILWRPRYLACDLCRLCRTTAASPPGLVLDRHPAGIAWKIQPQIIEQDLTQVGCHAVTLLAARVAKTQPASATTVAPSAIPEFQKLATRRRVSLYIDVFTITTLRSLRVLPVQTCHTPSSPIT